MRTLLRVLIPLVLAAAALLGVWLPYRAKTDALALGAERARLKREMVERALPARGLAAGRPREAVEESRALLRWYFEELQAIRNRHPRLASEPSLAALLEQRPRASAEERQTLEEFFRYAEERWQALRTGRYDPIQVSGAGGLRLDLISLQPGKSPVTQEPGVRIDFALWGAPRRTERESQAGGRVTERSAAAATFRQLALRFVDGEGKPWGEMTGSGEPYLKLSDPERFVADFPPGILFGSWWVDPFPREAARVELGLEVQVPGNAAAAAGGRLAFDLPVAEAWKLAPGVPFRGEARTDPSLPPARPGKR
jgi:hypothetical protein